MSQKYETRVVNGTETNELNLFLQIEQGLADLFLPQVVFIS